MGRDGGMSERLSDEQQAGLGAEEAWAAVAEEMGQAGHEAWKRYMIGQGYADHVWPNPPTFEDMVDASPNALELWVPCCLLGVLRHHDDMVPWADLPENKRDKYLEPAHDVFVAAHAGVTASLTDGAEWKIKIDPRAPSTPIDTCASVVWAGDERNVIKQIPYYAAELIVILHREIAEMKTAAQGSARVVEAALRRVEALADWIETFEDPDPVHGWPEVESARSFVAESRRSLTAALDGQPTPEVEQ